MDRDAKVLNRKRLLQIIGGTLAFLVLIGLGIGSLGTGLVYNLLRPQVVVSQPEIHLSGPVPSTEIHITLKADGTYLWEGEIVPGTSSHSRKEGLQEKISQIQGADIWNSVHFIINGEKETQAGQMIDVIQMVQATGADWETRVIERS